MRIAQLTLPLLAAVIMFQACGKGNGDNADGNDINAADQAPETLNVVGEWTDKEPRTEGDIYAIATYEFTDNNNYVLTYELYEDANAQNRIATYRNEGTYEVTGKSDKVDGAFNIVFTAKLKEMTLQTEDSALMQKAQLADCNLEYNTPIDVSASGCGYIKPLSEYGKDYDIASVKGGELFMGKRQAHERHNSPDKRPTQTGHVLKRKDAM